MPASILSISTFSVADFNCLEMRAMEQRQYFTVAWQAAAKVFTALLQCGKKRTSQHTRLGPIYSILCSYSTYQAISESYHGLFFHKLLLDSVELVSLHLMHVCDILDHYIYSDKSFFVWWKWIMRIMPVLDWITPVCHD